jgi:hypothetical protein
VVEKANKTEYGLAAAVFSKDINKCLAVGKRIRAGTVWINTYNIFDASAPFGGYKQSGTLRDSDLFYVLFLNFGVILMFMDLNVLKTFLLFEHYFNCVVLTRRLGP